jgi:hypothetical protein
MALTYCTETAMPALVAKWRRLAWTDDPLASLVEGYDYLAAGLFRSRQSSFGHQRKTE